MASSEAHRSARPLRVVVAAGGTAGHVVPALAVAEELRDRGAEVSFIGSEGRMEAGLVPREGFEIDLIEISGIDRRNPLKAARAAFGALPAALAAKRLLRERRADVVLGGGGFVVGPVGAAALRAGTPLVLTEADRHLGLANRMLAGRTRAVCLAYPPMDREGPRYRVTGRAIPRAVLGADRGRARQRFGIGHTSKALLVMGGSQGARSLNQAAIEAFAPDRGRSFHVIHLAGSRDYAALKQRLLEIGPRAYTLLEYEPDLGDCLAASDLVLARAGGSIFEIMAKALPAILVPYPHASADHQTANAEWMAGGGAATVIPDAEIDPERLVREIHDVLDRQVRLAEMSVASRALARPDAAARIADEVEAAAGIGRLRDGG